MKQSNEYLPGSPERFALELRYMFSEQIEELKTEFEVSGGDPAVSIPTSTGQFIWANEPTSVFTGDTSIALTSFLESSDFDIADGEDMMFVNRLIPDYAFNDTGVLQFKINTQEYPAAATIAVGPFTINRNTKKVDFRARGRQGNVRVSTGLLGTSWRWGSVRLAAQSDGKR